MSSITGIKQPNLSRLESGKVMPRRETVEKICAALKTTYDQIVNIGSELVGKPKIVYLVNDSSEGTTLFGATQYREVAEFQAGLFNGKVTQIELEMFPPRPVKKIEEVKIEDFGRSFDLG